MYGDTMTKGSVKGFNNERKKAKEWSLWLTNGERDDVIWRVGGSGGRATQRTKRGQTTAAGYGDLTFTDPIAEPLFRLLCIELKRGFSKDLDFMSLLDTKTGKCLFKTFWDKICKDSEEARKTGWGKWPVLITHRNRREALITMEEALVHEMGLWCGSTNMNMLTVKVDSEYLVAMKLKDFFDWVTPEVIRRMVNDSI
jgi:hypothetical protein